MPCHLLRKRIPSTTVGVIISKNKVSNTYNYAYTDYKAVGSSVTGKIGVRRLQTANVQAVDGTDDGNRNVLEALRCHKSTTPRPLKSSTQASISLHGHFLHEKSPIGKDGLETKPSEGICQSNTAQGSAGIYRGLRSQLGEHAPVAKRCNFEGLFETLKKQGIARDRYWSHIPWWKDVTEEQFLSYQWQVNPDHSPQIHASSDI